MTHKHPINIQAELRSILGDETWKYTEIPAKLERLITTTVENAVREAEDRVIDIAHKPCECGRDHFATPVRSVQGGITSYCQFSKVVPSSTSPDTTEGKDE